MAEEKRIVLDIGNAMEMLRASPELAQQLNELVIGKEAAAQLAEAHAEIERAHVEIARLRARPTEEGLASAICDAGYVIVPTEPTDAMYAAGADAFLDATRQHNAGDLSGVNRPFLTWWQEMIAARPLITPAGTLNEDDVARAICCPLGCQATGGDGDGCVAMRVNVGQRNALLALLRRGKE